jgi:hypothetical protein
MHGWLTNSGCSRCSLLYPDPCQPQPEEPTTLGLQQSAAQPPLSFQDPALQLLCRLSNASSLLTAVPCRQGAAAALLFIAAGAQEMQHFAAMHCPVYHTHKP